MLAGRQVADGCVSAGAELRHELRLRVANGRDENWLLVHQSVRRHNADCGRLCRLSLRAERFTVCGAADVVPKPERTGGAQLRAVEEHQHGRQQVVDGQSLHVRADFGALSQWRDEPAVPLPAAHHHEHYTAEWTRRWRNNHRALRHFIRYALRCALACFTAESSLELLSLFALRQRNSLCSAPIRQSRAMAP